MNKSANTIMTRGKTLDVVTTKGGNGKQRTTRFFATREQGKRCYGAQNMNTGAVILFSNKKKTYARLLQFFRDGGSIAFNGSGNNAKLCIGKQMYMSAKSYLYCLYHDIEPDSLKVNIYPVARHRTPQIDDCRENNLYPKGYSIFLDECEKCVVIQSNTGELRDVCDPCPVIVDIMSLPGNYIDSGKDGRMMCHFRKAGCICPLPDLALLAYGGGLTTENYIEKVREFKQYKESHSLTDEHLNSDYHNHFGYNLALVPGRLNSAKRDKVRQIIEPHFCVVVNDRRDRANKFKILIGKYDEDMLLTTKPGGEFITRDFQKVVDLIQTYADMFPEQLSRAEAKANYTGVMNDRQFCMNLAKAPDEQFQSLDELY